jgi:hypothetical protein
LKSELNAAYQITGWDSRLGRPIRFHVPYWVVSAGVDRRSDILRSFGISHYRPFIEGQSASFHDVRKPVLVAPLSEDFPTVFMLSDRCGDRLFR